MMLATVQTESSICTKAGRKARRRQIAAVQRECTGRHSKKPAMLVVAAGTELRGGSCRDRTSLLFLLRDDNTVYLTKATEQHMNVT